MMIRDIDNAEKMEGIVCDYFTSRGMTTRAEYGDEAVTIFISNVIGDVSVVEWQTALNGLTGSCAKVSGNATGTGLPRYKVTVPIWKEDRPTPSVTPVQRNNNNNYPHPTPVPSHGITKPSETWLVFLGMALLMVTLSLWMRQ